MRCNPLSWLWGLLPLALVAWVAWLAESPRIEKDLTTRAAAALAQKGLAWASPSFSARDGVVSGRAGDDKEQRQAADLVAGVWGVRSVTDRTDVIELIKTYTWSATSRDNTVRLAGYVPSETVRKEIIGTARATFPGRTIDDQMKLGRGAPEQNRWLGGITFGLKQLAQLKTGGRAELEGEALTVEGEAENPVVFRTVKTALGSQLPQGISLRSDKVTAPVIKPYTWSANHRGDQVELTGYAPNERVREQVVAEAKKAFPRANVVDRTVVGSGEPADWFKVVGVALARLGQLTEGKADLRDANLTVAGLTRQEDTAEAIHRSLKSDIPTSFKVDDQVRQDPKIKAEEEARRVAAAADAKRAAEAAEAARRAVEAEAAKRAAETAEETARRQVAEEAARRAAAEAAAQETARRAAADEAARRAAADEAARRAAAEVETRRVADSQRQQAEEQTRRAAAVAESQRVAAAAVARQREVATRCQDSLRSAAKDGVINFQRASAELERTSHATLDKLAEIAKTCPDAVIEIAGHTDAEGEAARNQRLSERRARSVADYLVKAGVPDSRLASVGHGDTQPIAPNDTAEQRARNRRIEFNVKAK